MLRWYRSQKRILERIGKQIVDVPLSQILEEFVEMERLGSQTREQHCNVEQIVEWLVCTKYVFEFQEHAVVPLVLRIWERIVEQVVDVPMPKILKEAGEVVR